MYVVLKEKTKCSILIAAVADARPDQLFLVIARAAELLTRGCISWFGVPFRVTSARNTEHSKTATAGSTVETEERRAVYAAHWGDLMERDLTEINST
ncbi:hypothetical protein NDU88_001838 [Pleurodeles waltl]|uniref:Uncharacterized protein n=1 Tax=Pleurodeles waltl TaxID=8319 RepID=A0AAV7NC99_PLEWA|nr:hypothetical protein NDU88_001838 [Pleurodeles waltl]